MNNKKVSKIVKESVGRYLRNVIKESIDNDELIKNDLIETIEHEDIVVYPGQHDIEIGDNIDGHFLYHIEYELNSNAYYEDDNNSYDEEPTSSVYGENDTELNITSITAMDNDGMSYDVDADEDVYEAFERNMRVDYSDYDYPSTDDMIEYDA